MVPVKLQIAFQGGGAKLPELLAFAEALYRVEKEGLIKVSRVAGTSAGAIAGALLSLSFAKRESVKTFSMRAKYEFGAQISSSLKMPSLPRVLWRLFRGVPIVEFVVLRDWLTALFSECQISTLDDLMVKSGVEVHIARCNLVTKRAVVCPGTSAIVSALEDSAAIPLFFRTWGKSSGAEVFVDGGLASNLPIEFLSQDEMGHLIGVSFESPYPNKPEKPLPFLLALIETAMGKMESDARARLPVSSLYSVDTKLSTFDFDMALNVGLEDRHFESAVEKAQSWIRQKVNDINISQGPAPPQNMWLDDNATASYVMRQAAEIYRLQEYPLKFNVLSCSVTVIAEGLRETNDRLSNIGFDSIESVMRIAAIDIPVKSVCFILYSGQEEFYRLLPDVSVSRGDGAKVDFVPMPARFRDEEVRGASRQIIVNFSEPLKPGGGEYVIRYRERVKGLVGLVRGTESRDDLVFAPLRAVGVIGVIDLVMMVPEDLQSNVELFAKSENGSIAGARMAADELPDAFDGLTAVGWRGRNIPVEEAENWGVDIHLRG